jgi:microcystin-dependent protein
MSEPFLGQLLCVPYNFSPRGWAFCNGQIMPIAQNTALFSLLGTTYGGNGQTTFALPDLRGRSAISSGQGPGLSMYDLGEVGGTENTNLNINQMPAHVHPMTGATLNVSSATKVGPTPGGNLLGGASIYVSGSADSTLAAGSLGGTTAVSGGSQPFSLLTPFLALNWIIALEGIFPSRN